jgi:hypothetical protein
LKELALHLLDISENSIAANAHNISILVEEDTTSDRLRMRVEDDGKGMDAETVKKVIDPFYTSRTTRKVGLGIPLLKEAAEACNGYLTIQSQIGKGTCVEVEFQRSHIDRMPLGDLAGTLLNMVVGSPQIHWVFRYRANQHTFIFDDEPIKQVLHEIPLTEPDVLAFIREILENGVRDAQSVLINN